MTNQKLIELYNNYQKAEEEYHKHMEQFFTIKINGTIINQATLGMSESERPAIEKLENEIKKTRTELNEAFKQLVKNKHLNN